jgi:RimJ/RimL family protein N-acetyltransferase
MSLAEHWPLFGLCITTPRLELRIPTDDDLADLVRVAADGVHDPATMPFTTPWTDAESPELERQTLQFFWRCRAEVSPEEWHLTFAVFVDGEPVGVQGITATDFAALRTPETGSWLGRRHQGQGIGKEMRAAVVHLAFEELSALAVTSAAFVENPASQRVSLAVGYEPNGTGFALRRGKRGEQIRYLLTRDRWLATRPPFPIEATGVEPCLPLLGCSDPDGQGEASTTASNHSPQ